MSIHGTLKNYISTTVMSTKQITYIVMTVFLFLIGIWVEQIIKTERGKTQFYRGNCEAHLKKKKKKILPWVMKPVKAVQQSAHPNSSIKP